MSVGCWSHSLKFREGRCEAGDSFGPLAVLAVHLIAVVTPRAPAATVPEASFYCFLFSGCCLHFLLTVTSDPPAVAISVLGFVCS